ncbi:hypothetical protein [Lacticaseibacillus pantheris]|uniref:hypothetical protein n=1 Tax=Lacticaseibacillus pantheris TaxID=171523 RepID=UPI0006D10915|nr:hypothetical protein [Lacticaseibacillus pantheris]
MITCTPYMVNSHRLLVTGRRVPYTAAVAKQADQGAKERYNRSTVILIAVVAGIIGLIVVLVWRQRR